MATIDLSQVPSDKLNHPDFINLKNQMEHALSQDLWIKAFCIHEAGHMTYFKQAGITQFAFDGPRIIYNGETDNFDGYMASVIPKAGAAPQKAEKVQEFFSTLAKAHVAGRVFTRQLTNAPDSGEEEDRHNFDKLCSELESGFPGITIDRKESWEQAEKEVLIDLRNPAFKTNAWQTAKEIEKTLFGS
jgi:hypothetical protein